MDPKLFQDRVEEVGDLNLRQEMADIQAQDPFDLAQGLPNRAEDPVRGAVEFFHKCQRSFYLTYISNFHFRSPKRRYRNESPPRSYREFSPVRYRNDSPPRSSHREFSPQRRRR